jgi:hypothetical protein
MDLQGVSASEERELSMNDYLGLHPDHTDTLTH